MCEIHVYQLTSNMCMQPKSEQTPGDLKVVHVIGHTCNAIPSPKRPMGSAPYIGPNNYVCAQIM